MTWFRLPLEAFRDPIVLKEVGVAFRLWAPELLSDPKSAWLGVAWESTNARNNNGDEARTMQAERAVFSMKL